MINILDKSKCCGCSACLHICPKHSITFKEDQEGFLYPNVDKSTCIECGLCEKVCPVLNQDQERKPLQVYAAKHTDDEIRMKSSSGGIFTLLAEHIIDKGGVVFGARFNENWEVVHDYTETKEGLAPFRGSKYVQSNIGNSYKQVEKFLKAGREVMFTGTPCQVAGLKKYLRKDYENLLTVDFVCHGVPSPMVWRKYLEEEIYSYNNVVITGINFREKSISWKNFSFIVEFTKTEDAGEQKKVFSSVFYDNSYMNAFLSNLGLRPSCYACLAKSGKSGADITIGDFWGIDLIDSYLSDDIGVSLVVVNNLAALSIIETCNFTEEEYCDVLKYNPALVNSANVHPQSELFLNSLKVIGVARAYKLCSSTNILCRIIRKIYQMI